MTGKGARGQMLPRTPAALLCLAMPRASAFPPPCRSAGETTRLWGSRVYTGPAYTEKRPRDDARSRPLTDGAQGSTADPAGTLAVAGGAAHSQPSLVTFSAGGQAPPSGGRTWWPEELSAGVAFPSPGSSKTVPPRYDARKEPCAVRVVCVCGGHSLRSPFPWSSGSGFDALLSSLLPSRMAG